MSSIATVYAQALYGLKKDEGTAETVLAQMDVLDESFRQEPGFVRLLGSANLAKEERCRIIDQSFRGKVDGDLLSFLKILTEKGYMRHFFDCCKAFRCFYNADNGILEVKAITAVPLTEKQQVRLCEKMTAITGKRIFLQNSIEPECLGGIRLDYDGKQVDDTLQHRLSSIRSLLSDTVL